MMNIKSPQLYGTCLVALSAALYGVMAYLGTQLFYAHFAVPTMLFWRFVVATIWMLGTALFLKKNIFSYDHSHQLLIKIILLAAIFYSGGSALYFIASQQIGTGLAMVIFFSYPVFVTLFAWMTRNFKMNRYAFISLLAVLIGLFCLKGNGEIAVNLIGIYIAILSGLFYALYIYSSRDSARAIDSHLLTLLICFSNMLIFFVWSRMTNEFLVPHTFHDWFYVIAIGVIATALPIQLLLIGLKYISPIKASIISVLEPVITVIIGVMFLHESISVVQTIGIIIVLLGALFIQLDKHELTKAITDA